eukprot:scaffold75475_cov22-Tisochrysis_lutea.AAC.1
MAMPKRERIGGPVRKGDMFSAYAAVLKAPLHSHQSDADSLKPCSLAAFKAALKQCTSSSARTTMDTNEHAQPAHLLIRNVAGGHLICSQERDVRVAAYRHHFHAGTAPRRPYTPVHARRQDFTIACIQGYAPGEGGSFALHFEAVTLKDSPFEWSALRDKGRDFPFSYYLNLTCVHLQQAVVNEEAQRHGLAQCGRSLELAAHTAAARGSQAVLMGLRVQGLKHD